MNHTVEELDRINLYELVRERACIQPDAIAFAEDRREMSYADFDRLIRSIALRLSGQGIGEGDRVAARVEKSIEGIALLFAVMAIGGVYVPVNPGFTPGEHAFIMADARPALLVSDDTRNAEDDSVGLIHARDGGTALAAPLEDISGLAIASGGTARCAAMLYTSGTTGKPKGAQVSHANLGHTFTMIGGLWEMTAQDRLLHILPTYHAHGLLMATMIPLFAGASIRLLPRFDVERVIELLPSVTAMMGVPTMYSRLAENAAFTHAACREIRLATCGSAPLSPELFDRVREKAGVELIERYGSTEAGMITANPAGKPKRGSVGRIVPGVDFRIVDAGRKPVPQGEVGRIQARGRHVFIGYWERPELAGLNFTDDGYFDTGDFGRLDEDGYLYIVGRDKDMIISGGYNVYPREVELALEGIEGVREAAVFGVPHPDYGEGVLAALRMENGAPLDETHLREALARQLASYKRPKGYVVMDDFPRNSLGKVLRADLIAAHKAHFT